MDGVLQLSTGTGARLLVIICDGHLVIVDEEGKLPAARGC